MKFRIKVKDEKSEWWEQYSKPDVRSKRAAKDWAESTVRWFNGTRHPGERERTLVEVDTDPENQRGQ